MIISPPDPKPLQLDNLIFEVVNKDNLEQFLTELKKYQNNKEYVFYAITPKTYEILALNMQEIKRYLIQQKEIIIYYKEATSKKRGKDITKKKE
tara:strand:- start:172 stop:453 length:282 start_codon:yes stop_codon:yes gene_type:complete